MPVSISQIKKAREVGYNTLVVRDRLGDLVTGVFISLKGMRGGRGPQSPLPVTYRCYLDLTTFPTDLPIFWILEPPEEQIRHVNIYRPAFCSKLGKKLPYICVGNLEKILQDWSKRTFLFTLAALRDIVNHQNFNSPARTS